MATYDASRGRRRPTAGAFPGAAQAAGVIVLRNYITYRSAWKVFLTGFLEPVFYLFSIGIGVGPLVEGFEFNGEPISYAAFVAPGMLAASAFNGAMMDSTFNVFFKLRYDRLYDRCSPPRCAPADVARGELAWWLIRGSTYSAGVRGGDGGDGAGGVLVGGAGLPAAILIGFAFSAVCMALTTWMKSWQDFDKITSPSCRCSCSRRPSSRSPRTATGCCAGWSRRRRSTGA